jgi:hypothetical protein
MPSEVKVPKLPAADGRRGHGFFTKRLIHAPSCTRRPDRGAGLGCAVPDCELAAIEALYADYRDAYPELDTIHDEADLCELIVTTVMLQRIAPESASQKHVFDYSVARAKLRVMLADQLGISRKQRKATSQKNDLMGALAEFFQKDGRDRVGTGRTVSTGKKTVLTPTVDLNPQSSHPADEPS